MPTPGPARVQMTVPETPSSAATAQVLNERLKAVQLGGGVGAPGGPGRFEDNTPSRRATKSRRVALQNGGARGPAELHWPSQTPCRVYGSMQQGLCRLRAH